MKRSESIAVAVTELEYAKGRAVFEAAARDGIDCFAAPAAEAALAAAVRARGARHAILGVDRYGGALYEALQAGGVLARFGVGYDGLDLALATRRRLYCTNTPGVLDQSVAEHALALMLAAARGLGDLFAGTKAGAWAPRLGAELHGRRLAVIGCGPIGCRVARLAARGFEMVVTGHDVRPLDAAVLGRDYGFDGVTARFEEAVAEADFISLHIPATPATRHFVGPERLTHLRPESWLVNTARGSVVDERALFAALRAGRLGGAALDVFEHEPYRPVDPAHDLRLLPNVLMTPHVSSSTAEACRRVAERALRNIRCAESGRIEELDLLNRDVA